MLTFYNNFRRVFNVAICKVVFNCDLIELNFIGYHGHGTRFTSYPYSTHSIGCGPLKTVRSNDCLHLDQFLMAKHKKASHHSKDKVAITFLETKEKVHKHSKKKRKKKSRSRPEKNDSHRKQHKLCKQSGTATSAPEVFVEDSNSNDIVILYDSRVGPVDKSGASEVTVVHENILVSGRSHEAVENIPLPDSPPVVTHKLGNRESVEVSSIPLPDSPVTTKTNFSAKSLGAIQLVEQSSSKKTSQTSTNHYVNNDKPKKHCKPEGDNDELIRFKKARGYAKQRQTVWKRIWNYTTMGAAMATEETKNVNQSHLIFDVLSYNVLSQRLMEDHPELYRVHDPRALDWDYRSQLLLKEFKSFNADILCLQEVQKNHLESFYSKLHNLGYSGIYKQRTGNKGDGVAIYYKKSVFDLIDHTTVEYYQPGIELLNRDNVGLVAKFAPKIKPEEHIVVATTHLLFNPRRHDIKLAQTQMLLAEIERFAFKDFDSSTGSAQYWPVILTGDLNLEPHTGVYKFLTTGSFQYEGLEQKTLTPGYGRILSKDLIPRDLEITDTCQHWRVMLQRHVKKFDHKTERNFLKMYNSDYKPDAEGTCTTSPQESWVNTIGSADKINTNGAVCSKEISSISIADKNFCTGKLSHNFNLRSVYIHDPEKWYDNSQVTTRQDRWVVVDYIFYSSMWEQYIQQKARDQLKLLARFRLLSEDEAEACGPIPNLKSPSDHYPLCAKFALLLV